MRILRRNKNRAQKKSTLFFVCFFHTVKQGENIPFFLFPVFVCGKKTTKTGRKCVIFFPIVLCAFVNLDKQGTNKKQGTEKWFGKNRAKKKTDRNCSLFFKIRWKNTKPKKQGTITTTKNRELKKSWAKAGQRKNTTEIVPFFSQSVGFFSVERKPNKKTGNDYKKTKQGTEMSKNRAKKKHTEIVPYFSTKQKSGEKKTNQKTGNNNNINTGN